MNDKKRVVVIDDSPIVRKMAEVALEEEGYEVYSAEDGEEGLKITQEVIPSVILVDFIMPKMSGYQFCQAIKENESLKDIPIILITGKGEDVGKKFLDKFGVIDYFIKPFKSADLVEKVNSIVQMQKTIFQVEEPISHSDYQKESMIIDIYKPEKLEISEEKKETEIIEQEPISVDFSESIDIEPLQELLEMETIQQETVPIDFPESIDFEPLQELLETETIQQETVSFVLPESIEDEKSKLAEVPFDNQKEKLQMETINVSYIENTVEKIAKRLLQEELQFTIQKSIADILKQAGVIKSTDILLSGDITVFPVKDILHLVANKKLTAKLSFLSESLIADIYISDGNLIFSSSNKEAKPSNIEKIQFAEITNQIELTEDMIHSIKENIYDTLSSVIQLEAGSFSIEKVSFLDNLKDLPYRLSIPNSLIKASRKVSDILFSNIFDEKTIFFKLLRDAYINEYELNKNEIRVFACINGERTAAEIIDISGLDRIEAFRAFYVLLNGDIIKIH